MVDEKTRASSGDEVLCFCVTYTRQFVPNLPRQDADQFVPNSTPFVGAVVIFKYPSGVSHIAVLDVLEGDRFHVKQANKTPCTETEEWISWDNPYIVGFYSPQVIHR